MNVANNETFEKAYQEECSKRPEAYWSAGDRIKHAKERLILDGYTHYRSFGKDKPLAN